MVRKIVENELFLTYSLDKSLQFSYIFSDEREYNLELFWHIVRINVKYSLTIKFLLYFFSMFSNFHREILEYEKKNQIKRKSSKIKKTPF